VLQIGSHRIDTRVVLAPMVGVTDAPFRALCARAGTRLAIAEMISADSRLWNTRKSRLRRADFREFRGQFTYPARGISKLSPEFTEIGWVQIAGNDPHAMAEAARAQADLGAAIIDINMGCPAKNVCGKGAGSALLRDEPLVAAIIKAVVGAVPALPVTLKMRTGWSPELRNGVRVARIAEDSGIQALSVHGRTRACRFEGSAEYETIRAIAHEVRIPVIANGDIRTARDAASVLAHTGASAVMIGRAAQGAPWLCGAIDVALRLGTSEQAPPRARIEHLLLEHLDALHAFYGEAQGLRIARKHVGWYLAVRPGAREFLRGFNAIETGAAQFAALRDYFHTNDEQGVIAA
jgi:tRNA-dihydrouridine synthase B